MLGEEQRANLVANLLRKDEPIVAKENEVVQITIDNINSFDGQPFKLYQGERLDDMVQSIKEHGVITPLIVRRINDEHFECLAGHNRINASKILGLDTVPCIVKENLDYKTALTYVIETNLMQRSFSDLLPSEKALVLHTRHEKTVSQGKRNDIINELLSLEKGDKIDENKTSSQVGKKLTTMDSNAKEYGLSKNSVARLLRIYELTNDLKIRVDSNAIALLSGVDLSYITKEEMQIVEKILSENEYKLDMKKAKLLREYSKNKKLNEEMAEKIISGELNKVKKSKPKTKNIILKPKLYKKYFNDQEDEKVVLEKIEKGLQLQNEYDVNYIEEAIKYYEENKG